MMVEKEEKKDEKKNLSIMWVSWVSQYEPSTSVKEKEKSGKDVVDFDCIAFLYSSRTLSRKSR
jgi:hypothetical protein